jgi:predicted GIY-YIG superfamily endonuclease/DNA-binding transcriptional regulator YiaG
MPMTTRPADPPRAGWAAVYRLYSGGNELLYIGSTVNAPQRWSHHRSTKDWWPTVAAYTLTWWTDAEQAYTEEYKAIRAEQPRLNKLGVFPFGEAQPTSEAAMRVIAAMDAMEAIEDPEHRARVISEITAIQAERSSRWREMRHEAVVQMRTAGTSYRKIATLLGVSLGTVQDIERGHSGAWGTKSRRKPATT